MNILIVNDDGYNSKGLKILAEALKHHGNIYIAAPREHKSGFSHAITFRKKIKIEYETNIPLAKEILVVDGTPADATRLGLKFFDVEFDCVVSGINEGPNISKDIHYSGTVAAAKEAKILGVPAIAISAHNINSEYIFDETVKIFDEIFQGKTYLGPGILNINFPSKEFSKPKGIKYTKMGKRLWHASFLKTEKENEFYIQSAVLAFEEEDNTDAKAFEEGYTSITPLIMNQTDIEWFRKLTKKI